MKSKNISRKTKIKVKPHSEKIHNYVCERGMDPHKPKLKLFQIVEKRILRGIYTLVRDNTTQQYRTRTKAELEKLYK